MTIDKKKEIYEKHRVHVAHGCWSSTSKCCKCDSHDKYMVFIGGSQLSNLHGTCCETHLGRLVDEALKEASNIVEKYIKQIEDKELESAMNLLRERKLKDVIE